MYDDDHYYMGGVLAELLAQNGCDVTLVTPAPLISYWSQFTLEQAKIQARLMKLGVMLFPQTLLSEIQPATVTPDSFFIWRDDHSPPRVCCAGHRPHL